MEHLRVIAHEGEVVVGLIKMHQRCGVQAEAGAEGRGRAARRAAERHGAGERSMAERRERGGRAAHTQHRRWDCGNGIGGEEVAATFRAPEDFSPRALCLCRYAPPATYSPFFFFACLYLSVKKNVGTK